MGSSREGFIREGFLERVYQVFFFFLRGFFKGVFREQVSERGFVRSFRIN